MQNDGNREFELLPSDIIAQKPLRQSDIALERQFGTGRIAASAHGPRFSTSLRITLLNCFRCSAGEVSFRGVIVQAR